MVPLTKSEGGCFNSTLRNRILTIAFARAIGGFDRFHGEKVAALIALKLAAIE